MHEVCGNIKTLLADMQGKGLSSTAKLVAILESCGITDRAEIEAILECKSSTLREARRALKIQRQNSSGDGIPAPEIQRTAGNPAQTPEIQRSEQAPLACADKTTRANNELPTEVSISKVELASYARDASELMVLDVIAWMNGGDRQCAERWLASTIQIFGHDAATGAYAKLKTDLATGAVVSKKLQAWTTIAQRLKASPQSAAPSKYDASRKPKSFAQFAAERGLQ